MNRNCAPYDGGRQLGVVCALSMLKGEWEAGKATALRIGTGRRGKRIVKQKREAQQQEPPPYSVDEAHLAEQES